MLADYLRKTAIEAGKSFSFETVMSSQDKVDLLSETRSKGYRTYLYYIATEDPEINVARVSTRVAEGGHDVPSDKVIARYYRSIKLLPEAIRHVNRGFLFDTSGEQPLYFAEVTDGSTMHRQPPRPQALPAWSPSLPFVRDAGY